LQSGDPAFLRRTATGVTVALRAQPRARRIALDCEGGALKAAVTAPAEDGRANHAIIDLLAGTWRLPKSAFAVMRGATHRDKVLSVDGEPGELVGRIKDWLKGCAGRDG
jgi:uncharacterized protein YggU (UPF0235/DUF167 family)